MKKKIKIIMRLTNTYHNRVSYPRGKRKLPYNTRFFQYLYINKQKKKTSSLSCLASLFFFLFFVFAFTTDACPSANEMFSFERRNWKTQAWYQRYLIVKLDTGWVIVMIIVRVAQKKSSRFVKGDSLITPLWKKKPNKIVARGERHFSKRNNWK